MKASEKKAWAKSLPLKTPTLSKIISGLDKAAGYMKKGWCQGTDGKTADGEECSYSSKKAARWCFNGALLKAGIAKHYDSINTTARDHFDVSDLVSYNDECGRKKSQVIAMTKKLLGLYQFALDQRSKKGA